MSNGGQDSLIPCDSVLTLYEAARPPKEMIWVEGGHVQPDEARLIGQLSGTVAGWLAKRGLFPLRRS